MVDRRQFLRAGVGAFAAAALSGCASTAPWQAASGTLRIAAGNPGAVFDEYGRALADEARVAMPSLDASAVTTAGSAANVRDVLDGSADVGFCLGDTATSAVAGHDPFDEPMPIVAVARLYDSFLQILVRQDSPVRTPADLVGRRIVGGEVESGTRLAVSRCLEAAGLGPDDVRYAPRSLTDAASDLAAGTADAVAFVSGFPITALVELGTRVPLRALDIGGLVDPLVERWGPSYVTGPLPRGPYGLPTDVTTVSIKTYLVASPALAEDTVYGLASVLFDRQDAVARRAPTVRQPTVAAGMFTAPVPLHPGSLRWFRDRDARGGS